MTRELTFEEWLTNQPSIYPAECNKCGNEIPNHYAIDSSMGTSDFSVYCEDCTKVRYRKEQLLKEREK